MVVNKKQGNKPIYKWSTYVFLEQCFGKMARERKSSFFTSGRFLVVQANYAERKLLSDVPWTVAWFSYL